MATEGEKGRIWGGVLAQDNEDMCTDTHMWTGHVQRLETVVSVGHFEPFSTMDWNHTLRSCRWFILVAHTRCSYLQLKPEAQAHTEIF